MGFRFGWRRAGRARVPQSTTWGPPPRLKGLVRSTNLETLRDSPRETGQVSDTPRSRATARCRRPSVQALAVLFAHRLFDRLLDRGKLRAPVVLRAHGPFRRIATDSLNELRQIDDLVRLPAQFVGHHWRLGRYRRYDR